MRINNFGEKSFIYCIHYTAVVKSDVWPSKIQIVAPLFKHIFYVGLK